MPKNIDTEDAKPLLLQMDINIFPIEKSPIAFT